MDVQAEDAGLRADPNATAVFGRPPVSGGGQGQLFSDTYPTYAQTDQIPVVSRGRSGYVPGPSRWLRLAVTVAALFVVAAGVTLALVKTGVIGKNTGTPSAAQSQSQSQASGNVAQTQHPSHGSSKTLLLTQVSTGAGTATYKIGVGAYGVTVRSSVGRAWVSIGISGQTPIFQGIVQPNSAHKEILLGAGQVDVGAGGTTVVVTSGHRSQTLVPPSAPFDYQIVTGS
jgi:hypothetical protein